MNKIKQALRKFWYGMLGEDVPPTSFEEGFFAGVQKSVELLHKLAEKSPDMTIKEFLEGVKK